MWEMGLSPWPGWEHPWVQGGQWPVEGSSGPAMAGGGKLGPPQEEDLHPRDTHTTGMCVQLRVSLELQGGDEAGPLWGSPVPTVVTPPSWPNPPFPCRLRSAEVLVSHLCPVPGRREGLAGW